MSFKEIFANYLEESAAEIRAFRLDKTYLEEVYYSMKDALEDFYIQGIEEARLKPIDK